jgi:hypothetical protein
MSKSRARSPLVGPGALVALALPGVLSTLLVAPAPPGVPRPALLVGPLSTSIAAALVGGWACPRVGLRSRVAARLASGEGSWFPREAGRWSLVGTLVGATVAALDHASRAVWQVQSVPPSIVEAWRPESLVVGLTYGGVVEELVFRWGMVGGLAWLFARASQSHRLVYGFAIALAALAFGLAHLPSVGPVGSMPAPWLRTVGLNALLGVGLGAVFVRRDLETAMIVHGSLHVGFALVAGIGQAW